MFAPCVRNTYSMKDNQVECHDENKESGMMNDVNARAGFNERFNFQ